MDIRSINRAVIEQFRAGGEVEGMHRDRLLLLTTTGRRSGEPRTSPMMFHPDGERLLVIASDMGAATHPAWYLNLAADPHVVVEVGRERYPALAEVLSGAERDRVWSEITQAHPFFVDHEAKAGDREIPVVALTRA
ncbi:nitroreductase/quinone reductase family protein [Pseudonocardia humida]|uniref:Nitroreductase family deazaflavin-dependent oxidoreductase n=1 Tax=Pseudonocardia humida TaxID=2800819 RepID=A0ABT1A4Z3_9PSEU|nr:nitroreductase/quinone reductase family protein [Pseudonocardia humida]MCO1657996.1 nitroreductase family deazaflavin-dependent oxidoreductase [Pseudonocardia humida]